jgi:hypothetical protein
MPASVIDPADFPTLLDANYTRILEYEQASVEDIRPQIYETITTDRLEERSTSVGGLQPWGEFTGQIAFQRAYEQFETRFRPREYAAATVITRRMLRDDLSGVLAGAKFRPMVRAGLVTEQLHATRVFENIDIVDNHWTYRSEGVPLASLSHLTKTPGVSTATGFGNLSLAPLSEVALRAALIAGRKIRSSEGQRMNMHYDALIVPVDLVPLAHEILRTVQGLNTPALNESQESSARSGITKVIGLPYLSRTSMWVLVNEMMMKDALKWVTSEDPVYGRMTEFNTLQVKNRGYMRHGVWASDWRPFYVGLG